MAKLSVEQSLAKAKSHAKKGELAEAQGLYAAVIKVFPNNKKAQQGLTSLGCGKQSRAEQSPPQETLNQLVNFCNQGRLAYAAEQAEALTKIYPDSFILWNMLGVVCAQIGRLDHAIFALQKVLTLKPDHFEAYNNLGSTFKEQGNLDEAIEAYNKALALNPDYAEAYYNMGVVLKEQGKLEEAVEAYNKALSLKPDSAGAYNNKGNALKDQGKLEEAMQAYNKALALNPDYAEAYNNLGNVLREQGKLEEAMQAYNKAIKLKPNYADAYSNLGNSLKKQGKLEEAIQAYYKALSLKPDNAGAYNNKGNALKDQGKLEEAIEAYNKALALNPDYAEAYYNLGNALNDQGKLEEVIEAYNKALSLKPDYAAAHNNMGNVLKDQGKLEEAIEAYNKALALNPNYAEAFNNKGNALKDQGRLGEAIEAYNKALSLEPNYAEAARNLVKIPLGRIDDKIIAALNRNLSLLCDNIEDQSERLFFEANVLLHRGKQDDAFNAFIEANRIKSQTVFSGRQPLEQKFDMTVKRMKSWSPNSQIQTEPSLKKLFLLGPSRSGKTTLEQLLIPSTNVYAMFENINVNYMSNAETLRGEFNNKNIYKLFYQHNESLLSDGFDIITSTLPGSIFHIDALIDSLANTFCVLVKRNRMDIASEMFIKEYRQGNFYSYSYLSIMNYLDTYEAIWKIIKKKVPQRILEISFEDILIKPQEVVEMISHLTGVSFQTENLPTYSDYSLVSPFRDHFERKFIN